MDLGNNADEEAEISRLQHSFYGKKTRKDSRSLVGVLKCVKLIVELPFSLIL